MHITIGHDGELFAQNALGQVMSCEGLVGGTKEDPSKCKKGALQEDCVMAELNIIPARTANDFVDNTIAVMQELAKRLKKYDLDLLIQPSAEFEGDQLLSEQARISGCVADFDAWSMRTNPAINLETTNKRYAGGHIHMGVPFRGNPKMISQLIRRCDQTHALGMFVKHGISERFRAYGRFGAYRPTPYGCEYRTMDNTWLKDKADMKWVFNVAVHNIQSIAINPAANDILDKDELQYLVDNELFGKMKKVANAFLPSSLKL